MFINFMIIQSAPGGPVEKAIAQIKGTVSVTDRVTKNDRGDTQNTKTVTSDVDSRYKGSQGIDPDMIKKLEEFYGFDKPLVQRFFMMMKNYVTFNFGESYFQDRKVVDLILERVPVSISLGLWTTLLVYLISIPLGIKKAIRDGSRFDVATSFVTTIGYAIPGFIFAILLVVLFAGGTFLKIFPLRGLVSENWQDLSFIMKIADYFWHLVLPIIAMTIGGFATLTLFTKNCFLAEISKQYVIIARAKGNSEKRVLYRHVFRNAMLLIISGFPAALISIFFTGSVLIEVVFSIEGLGLLGFESALNRDYNIMFATMYFFGLLGLVMKIVSDIMMSIIDPRLDFESRRV
jgi:microcin C transport system permease protein